MIPQFFRNDNYERAMAMRRTQISATANVSAHPIQSAATNTPRAEAPSGVSEKSAIGAMTRATVTPSGAAVARNIHRR